MYNNIFVIVVVSCLLLCTTNSFTINHERIVSNLRRISTTTTTTTKSTTTTTGSSLFQQSTTTAANDVYVAKVGGRGAQTASEQAAGQGLSLGAPPIRPTNGHYTTRGGIEIITTVDRLQFVSSSTTSTTSTTSTLSTVLDANVDSTTSTSTTTTSLGAIEEIIDLLDSQKGVLLSSSYEFPGRYARWSIGFVNPPIQITGKPNGVCIIDALNERGIILLPSILQSLQLLQNNNILSKIEIMNKDSTTDIPQRIIAYVQPPGDVGTFSEEERSRQPSLFSIIRTIVDLFHYSGTSNDSGTSSGTTTSTTTGNVIRQQLGLYGAFGYDLTFQFEPIDLKQSTRNVTEQRDLILYIPDSIVVVDQDKRDAWRVSYDFTIPSSSLSDENTISKTTIGLPRTGSIEPFVPYNENSPIIEYVPRDTPQHMFADNVEKAKREFAVGNLFEAVLSQTFREKLISSNKQCPSKLFRRLRSRNPAPYGFFINLGQQEYLVGASPEMFVRCESTIDNDYRPNAIRVETCPISGTVARGADALEDAQRVKSLMMNTKEESELTMCTDVDRNDKSRICEPGSVQVIGRRQIEMYSRLIHTVDHVEGYLRTNFDSLDAFLCHTWAVTVTGAPKTWAIQFIEDTESSCRHWYGGAVGMIGFDGSLNTGLTLRTVRILHGIAEVRAGATLLYDSSPPAEELETELKASAMIDAIVHIDDDNDDDVNTVNSDNNRKTGTTVQTNNSKLIGTGLDIILIDHEDSFVHTLGNYLRQTGANVLTLRSGTSALQYIEDLVIQQNKKPDLVVLSPGPGTPSDFQLNTTIDLLLKYNIPGFGVCLGLQGMVEYFGGKLGILSYPMHGKPSNVAITSLGRNRHDSIFTSLPDTFEVARYHSLYGLRQYMPDCLDITAVTVNDDIVMGIQHKTLPYAAVQFHPESILTSPKHGMLILQNALSVLKYKKEEEQE